MKIGESDSSIFIASKFDVDSIFLNNNTRNISKVTEEIIDTERRNMKLYFKRKNRILS